MDKTLKGSDIPAIRLGQWFTVSHRSYHVTEIEIHIIELCLELFAQEAVICHDLGVKLGGLFGNPGSIRIGKVDVVQPKLFPAMTING